MVDVSQKDHSERIAIAVGFIKMTQKAYDIIDKGSAKKGDVLGVARLAGIMGAKSTANLIPLCHPLPLSKITLDFLPQPDLPGIQIEAQVKTTGQTGVEMVASTAVNIAALTIYDMMKAVDKKMEIGGIRLKLKDGGKSGRFEACLLYTSPSPRDGLLSRMPSSA